MRRVYPLGDLPPSQEGALAGKIAGTFLPIPGLSTIGGLIGGLIGGKPSNDSAYAEFSAGPIPSPQHYPMGATRCGGTYGNVCGTEMTSQTEAMASAVSDALWSLIQRYVAAGVRFNSPIFAVEVGVRDPARIHHPGTESDYVSSVAAPGDVSGAATGAMNWLMQFASSSSAVPTILQPLPMMTGVTSVPSVSSTTPLPGGTDYQSVQAAPATTVPAAPAVAAPSLALASFLSPPMLVIGGLAFVALLLTSKE